jgi:uncharacterized RDD family membrane protein YckC
MKKVGIGTRVLNFIVDTIIVFFIAFAVYKIRNWYVMYYHATYYYFGWYFFAALFVYYTFFESIWARTPGKWLTYSKVVDANNNKPNFTKIIIRSLIRVTIIDMFFIPFLNDKTLHDYASKTEVVEI